MEAGLKPLARSENLIVERLDGEVLVYDKQTDRGHCLSREAALVWDRCDGRTPVGGLSAQLGLDADVVERALGELETCDLLDTAELPDVGSTRREVTVKMVKVGGAVAAAPLIASIAAPTPAAAQSPVEGCEAVLECLFDCGTTDHGCKNPSGCCCCQLPRIDCRDGVECNGVVVQRPADVKWCAPATAGTPSICATQICPPLTDDPCLCSSFTPCPPEFQRSGATKSTQSTAAPESPAAPTEPSAAPTEPSAAPPAPTAPTTTTTTTTGADATGAAAPPSP